MSLKDKVTSFLASFGRKVKSVFRTSETNSSLDPDSDNNETEPQNSSSKKWKKLTLASLAVLLILFVLTVAIFSVGIYKYQWQDKATNFVRQTLPFPAGVVGLKTITINQVDQEAHRVEFFNQQAPSDQVAQNTDPDVLRNRILDQLVEFEIIKNLAKKYDVRATSDEIDQQYDQLAQQNGGQDKLKNMLKEKYDMEVAAFKDLISRSLLYEKLSQKFENELRKKAKVSHILIEVDRDASKKKVNEAKKKANNLLEKVRGDADFAEIAKKQSQDKSSKDDGGQLPWFGRGDIPLEEFEEKVFNMEIGSVSDLVRTDYGFHIIKLEEKRGEIDKTMEEWIGEMKDKWFVAKLIKW